MSIMYQFNVDAETDRRALVTNHYLSSGLSSGGKITLTCPDCGETVDFDFDDWPIVDYTHPPAECTTKLIQWNVV